MTRRMHRRVERSGNGVMASVVFDTHTDLSALIRLSNFRKTLTRAFAKSAVLFAKAATGTNTLAVASFAMGD